MKVKILNPEQAKELFKNWGEVAKVCYDTKTSHPEKIGLSCKESGHFSGSRGDYIKFLVTDIPRFTVDQIARMEVGCFKNVQSFRYVSKGSFAYSIPAEIIDSDLEDEYISHMEDVMTLYCQIQEFVKKKTGDKERANEQARYVLPMATHSAFVMGFTVEALIHLANVRLCVRAEDYIRILVKEMCKQVVELVPELKDDLVPQCQRYLWCPEGNHSCGAYLTKEEVKKILEEAKKK